MKKYFYFLQRWQLNRLMLDSNQRFLLPASVLAAELMSLCTQTNFNVHIYFCKMP